MCCDDLLGEVARRLAAAAGTRGSMRRLRTPRRRPDTMGRRARWVWTVSLSEAWHSPRSSSHNASTSRQRMCGNSFGGESSDLRAENAAQDAHGAVNVRFDRSDRLIEDLGDLRVAAPFDESQGRRRAQDASATASSARSTRAISVFCSTIVSGCGGPSLDSRRSASGSASASSATLAGRLLRSRLRVTFSVIV